jgi:hypothetical protein
MNQIRILLKILLLQATAIIQVIRLSNYGNFRTVGALSSPRLPTSLRKIKCFASQPLFEIWDGLPLSVTLYDKVFSC